MSGKAYIVVSNMKVQEVEIIRNGRDYCVVGDAFLQTGIRIRKSRVFLTRQEAERHLPYRKRAEAAQKSGYASPYDYE